MEKEIKKLKKGIAGISTRHNPFVSIKNATSGITLIALVVTIVILIILASISINVIVGENGLIAKAEQVKHIANISQYKEQIELIVLDEYTEKAMEEKETALTALVKETLEKEKWVATVEEDEEDENKLIVYTTDGYRIVAEILEDGNVNVEGEVDDGEPYPKLSITRLKLEGTENEKVKIQVIATINRTTENSTKVEKIKLIEPSNQASEQEYIEGGVVFEIEGNGKYVFEAITDGGKSSKKSIEINLTDITDEITITAEPTSARNTSKTETQNEVETGAIKVTINYEETELKKQYRVGANAEWTTIEDSKESIEIEVTENITVYARYYEEGVGGRNTVSTNIQNVDNVAPTISAYNATVSGATITASMTATDTAADSNGTGGASGIAGIKTKQYSIDGSKYQTSTAFTVTSAGTYTIYFKAIDNAGNETIVTKSVTVSSYSITYDANNGSGEPSAQSTIAGTSITLSNTKPTRTGYSFLGWSTSSSATSATYTAGQTITPTASMKLYAVWKLDNTAPTTLTASVSSRGTSSFTVKASATDADSDNLTYKLYIKSASASSYSLKTTSSSTASGTAVSLTASSLSSYTVYTYYVTVTDGTATTTGTTITTGTGCSGTGNTCTGPFTCSSTTKTSYVCGKMTESSTKSYDGICGSCGYDGSVFTVKYTCAECGGYITRDACSVPGCSIYVTTMVNKTFSHIRYTYSCSTHSYSGTSASHSISCTHGKTASHSYCSHGKTSTHYPN